MATIEQRLAEIGVTLPEAAAPAANYIPYSFASDGLLMTSGQLPLNAGKLVHAGLLGKDLSVEQGQEAAKWCAINILAHAKTALRDLEHIKSVIKISVFVASTPDFTEQHLVANGASDFLAAVLGEKKGQHARSAVGMASLPFNAPVEIEAIIAVSA